MNVGDRVAVKGTVDIVHLDGSVTVRTRYVGSTDGKSTQTVHVDAADVVRPVAESMRELADDLNESAKMLKDRCARMRVVPTDTQQAQIDCLEATAIEIISRLA